jgi:alcohol dehydrogenase
MMVRTARSSNGGFGRWGSETDQYHRDRPGRTHAERLIGTLLPTGFECGVLNGKVAPGSTVAIVGAGPIGLAALLTAQFYSPAEVIMIDLDDNRLEVARRFGATQTINSGDERRRRRSMRLPLVKGWMPRSRRWAYRQPSSSARTW